MVSTDVNYCIPHESFSLEMSILSPFQVLRALLEQKHPKHGSLCDTLGFAAVIFCFRTRERQILYLHRRILDQHGADGPVGYVFFKTARHYT